MKYSYKIKSQEWIVVYLPHLDIIGLMRKKTKIDSAYVVILGNL